MYNIVLTLSLDEMLKCDRSNERYLVLLSGGDVYCAGQGGSTFLSLWIKSLVYCPLKLKLLLLWCCVSSK